MTMQAPYPADTRARGWRFALDTERIRQSDTWAITPAEARPWLLMLWMVAWEQVPCGSLPRDEALIAARIEMPPKLWAKHRAALLRGWDLADDGRRYHRVLTERVVEMMTTRRRESDRKALARARKGDASTEESHGCPTDVPLDNHGTTAGLHPESDTGTGTGTGTYTNTKDTHPLPPLPASPPPSPPPTPAPAASPPAAVAAAPPAPPRKRGGAVSAPGLGVPELVAEGVEPQAAADWLAVRKAKGMPLTVTAWRQTCDEAAKARIAPAEAVRIAAGSGWAGFRADWLHADGAAAAGGGRLSARVAEGAKWSRHLGLDRPSPPPAERRGTAEIIDLEAINAARPALG
jgi:hypothetical protein